MATIKNGNTILDIYILIYKTEEGEVFVESHTDETLKTELLKDTYVDARFLSEYPKGELCNGEAMIIHTDTDDVIVPLYKKDVEF